MKKLIAMVLVLCLVLPMVPITASAAGVVASGECGDNLSWALTEDGKLTISGTGEMYDYEAYESPWYAYAGRITELEIGEGVTSIGKYAFYHCWELTGVSIPDSVTDIGYGAFCWCYDLETVTLGKNVSYIGSYAFYGSESLTGFCVDGANEFYSSDDRGVLFDKEMRFLILAPAGIAGHYIIPDSVEEVCSGAFHGCTELTEVTIGSGVSLVQSDEFLSCTGLTAIHVDPENEYYSSDDRGVLYSWNKNTLIAAPARLSGQYTVSNRVADISHYAFNGCSNLTSVTIPAGTLWIGDYAFENCGGLQEIRFLGSMPDIYAPVFHELTATVYYPSGDATWTEAARNSFGGDITWKTHAVTYGVLDQGTCGKKLTWTLMENGTLVISGTGNMYDFTDDEQPWDEYADWFSRVEIENKVTSLGDCAFYDCDRLETVTIPKSVTSIGEFAFDSCNSLCAIWVAEDNPVFSSDDRGVLFDKNKRTLIRGPHFLEGHYTIPDTVTTLGYGAFEFCNLETVTIPDTIQKISDYAFSASSIVEIDLPDSIRSIGEAAFMACTRMTTVVIPDSVVSIGARAFWGNSKPYGITVGVGDSVVIGPGGEEMEKCDEIPGLREARIGKGVAEIGPEAFVDCDQLTAFHVDPANAHYCNDNRGVLLNKQKTELIQAPGAISGHYTIPNTVTKIGDWAMSVCPNLTSVKIPASVTQIGDYAFAAHSDFYFGYETNLEEITFCGNAPEMGRLMFWDIEATAYYPAGNETWTEDVMQDYGGTITWVPYEAEEEEYIVQWKGGGTSLNGTVDLSVLAVLSENLVNDPSTVVRFNYAGTTVDVPMADARPEMKNGEQRYRFFINMYAKQMADRVTFQVYTDKGPVGEERSYSIQEYCTNMIGKTTDPAYLTMYKALLNYGAAAQMRFNYNTENLANANLSDADKALPENVDVSAYERKLTGSEEGIRAKGGTLILDETVIIRVKYELEEGRDISDYTFAIDGAEVQPKYMGDNIWCVETAGIPAKELDKMHTFTCGGITAEYGALSYVLSKLNSTDPLDVQMVKALYAYWAAAKAVLG